jgi:lipoyl(octanoyl) transferase
LATLELSADASIAQGVAVTAVQRCDVRMLGEVAYDEAWALQRWLAEDRAEDRIPDTLLLLEHPHTYTLGRTGDPGNILLSRDELAARGVAVYETDRGGDVTYHGPGQLVGYPIMRIEDRSDVLRYIRCLEEVLIRTLADFDIQADRIAGLSGVWIGDEKIAAIGVKMGRVTSHGFALNVTTDLDYFGHIIPCGIRDKGVTSIARVRLPGAPQVSLSDVVVRVVGHFGSVFDREMWQA